MVGLLVGGLLASTVTGLFVRPGEAGPPSARQPAAEARRLPSPPEPAPMRFTLVATGDILVHASVADRARAYAGGPDSFDFRSMFAAVRSVIRGADVAICHLETPLSPHNADLSSYPMFNAPRQVAAAIRYAGYDACSTASNHSLDRGADGVTATLDVLDAAGIPHAGTARSLRERLRPLLLDVPGGEVALLSYTYGLNGLSLPSGEPWRVGLIDPDRILRDARRARSRGAELVIVSLHWGDEYISRPTAFQREVARRVLSSPAVDLILGHHAHVVQPIRRVGGKFAVYGMGNFLSGQSAACCPAGTQDGVIVEIVIEERDDGLKPIRVRYTPTWVEPGTYRVLPVGGALEDAQTPPETRLALQQSWERTVSVMGTRKGILPADPPPR